MATVIISKKPYDKGSSSTSSLTVTTPTLGAPEVKRRFFWQRRKGIDLDAIATQPSVFDDPATAEQYHPRKDWENYHRFDPKERWTWKEEARVVRKIDIKIMVFTCIMFMALELDRANLGQALSDNFLHDTRLTRDDYNLGNTVFKLAFLCAELPSQLVSKWMGPDRWIPLQMVLWSVVAAAQFWLSGKKSFLVCRALLAILQGGFIPDIILYLSYFYKHHELTVRLGYFWTAMSIADILSAILAYGLLHMRGVGGYAGWRWLFLLEGLLTLVIGLVASVLMPPGPCQTASRFRGKNGWFSEREQKIIVNRVLREDPNKSSMHNREPITPKLLWQSLKDFDLWPLYILGLMFQIPMTPVQQYLTLSLRDLGFDTFQTNLLTIPYTVMHMITMLGLVYLAEAIKELTLTALLGQIWVLPFLIYLNVFDYSGVNRWVLWTVVTLLLSFPNDDAPKYKRGNKNLLGVLFGNIGIYLLVKVYYVWRNKSRDKKWNAMSEEQQLEYLATTKDEGNKRLDFRFQH
ncbi:uncharacterized protein E0L32_007746 [Thyridium curvatum]|uniref:Phthalate transporter n=1 Tax=Thyridium curvatum TaxID=1093900 RepID=A0A507ALN3_9PEZI|nr:uncharacterized protein E0L32_007746 [Thyridium curvatum]TPX11535.1 hypothetical protein E0L32_007746 [Thyridium curvatum]